MSAACKFDGCTVGETGKCALERDPNTCENRSSGLAQALLARSDAAPATDGIGAPVLEQPQGAAQFPSSRTLGPEVVSELMASRYVSVVGILGDPESGKTACLASLYLLVSNAKLKGWSFSDSKSLMAFEDIARGAREWNEGNPPEQMTVHTEMADDRRPGFLHLRLVRTSDGRRVDLVLPDLPGEWTQALIKTARTDRFDFMKSAEAIWVVVDGRALANVEQRQGAIARLGQLAGRLQTHFGGDVPHLILVLTHHDVSDIEADVVGRITTELGKRSITAEIVKVASFSDAKGVKPGFGLDSLIERTLGAEPALPEFWPKTAPRPGARPYLNYRSDR